MSGNRLPTTHQLHAATPPLTDRHAALYWMHSGVNWSSNALTCTDCTITQGQSAMLCFAACGKLSVQARTCTDCKPLNPSDMTVMENWVLANLATAGGWHWLLSNPGCHRGPSCRYVQLIRLDIPSMTVASLHTVGHGCRVPLHENFMWNCSSKWLGVIPCPHDLERYTHTETLRTSGVCSLRSCTSHNVELGSIGIYPFRKRLSSRASHYIPMAELSILNPGLE